MEFVFNILILLLLAPIAYVVAYLRYGKLLKALYAFAMSPYAVIPFIWLAIATSWQIGLAALLLFGLLGFRINLYLLSRAMKLLEEEPDEKLEKAVVEKTAALTSNFAQMDSGKFNPVRVVFQTAFHVASAY